MPTLDLAQIGNWIIAGLIACIFGTLSAFATHRYERKRDDLEWDREKEKLKSQYQIDLDKLREEVKQELYKQREIAVQTDILPTIWKDLQDALGRVSIAITLFKMHPDLNRMTVDELGEFLANTEFGTAHRKQIAEALDKTEQFIKLSILYEYQRARNSLIVFHNYLLNQRIFVDRELFDKLLGFDKELDNLLLESELLRTYSPHEFLENNKKHQGFQEMMADRMAEIETLMRRKLGTL